MIFIIWGEDKSAKNTLALTFPKPIIDMELDIGGFERSCRNLYRPAVDGQAELNLPIRDWYKAGLIKLEQFVVPFQVGEVDPVTSIVRQSKLVIGMKELFYKFAGRYIALLKDPNVQTIFVDTGTLLYDITCQGYVQELQEKQLPLKPNTNLGQDGKLLRTQLQPIEYREPYIRMRGFIYQAKAYHKNLVLTHHATDEYGIIRQRDGTIGEGKTGKRVLHGWGQLGDGADVVGNTYWVPPKIDLATNRVITPGKPYFRVELAEVKELEGMVIEEPTYDKIHAIISMIRGEE